MPFTNAGLNGANVRPPCISLFIVNDSIFAEYTLD